MYTMIWKAVFSVPVFVKKHGSRPCWLMDRRNGPPPDKTRMHSVSLSTLQVPSTAKQQQNKNMELFQISCYLVNAFILQNLWILLTNLLDETFLGY